MWLTHGFLVTFFGRWWGAVRIHVRHVQLPYTVNSRVVVGAIYAYMCTYSYRTRCTVHGELTCGGGGNIRMWELLTCGGDIHMWELLTCGGAFTCGTYSRVAGAIYAYMCTYSYRTWCTIHGVLTCGGGGNIRIHVYLQLPYTVYRTQ